MVVTGSALPIAFRNPPGLTLEGLTPGYLSSRSPVVDEQQVDHPTDRVCYERCQYYEGCYPNITAQPFSLITCSPCFQQFLRIRPCQCRLYPSNNHPGLKDACVHEGNHPHGHPQHRPSTHHQGPCGPRMRPMTLSSLCRVVSI